MLNLGIDLGSTTVKFVLLNQEGKLLSRRYTRHRSNVLGTLIDILEPIADTPGSLRVIFSGSGALGLAKALGVGFIQEVVSDRLYLKSVAPETDVAIELGGEDAKLLYLTDGIELRMNEACAGGTGAFIDQMAVLLNTDAAGMNDLAARATASYPIASRCGVFAKTDLVSLLNSGVPREDIARSVFDAVAEQTLSGLACGRPVAGHVAFLGGPLAFLSEQREAFKRRLTVPGTQFSELTDTQYAVATGAAREAAERQTVDFPTLAAFIEQLKTNSVKQSIPTLSPLFADQAQKEAFKARHAKDTVAVCDIGEASGPLYLGVDLGSTTVKGVVIDAKGRLVFQWYENNEGHPLERLFTQMRALLAALPENAYIKSACTTGYGADLAQAALAAPFTEVETLAHERAAAAFNPSVSYVIDIGGQDMKCMAVSDGRITSVKLNEACSSGCGSFLQTFAGQLKLTLPEFVAAAERSRHPCDLGTRCTVFMTSMVRQAQRAGSALEDIAAGLCRSVVRNALYKVLRMHSPEELGENVVVQGGTFLNDAVLRSFEEETGLNVTRPSIAGLMGAYGAALIARERSAQTDETMPLAAKNLTCQGIIRRAFRCRGCSNHCALELNRFPNGAKYVSGNRCDFAVHSLGGRKKLTQGYVTRKLDLLFNRLVLQVSEAKRGTIGIARVLNIYEHYPYWNALFTALGFAVVLSDATDKGTLAAATGTIPSQSLCFPAKLAHGHVVRLAEQGVKTVWLPCIPREGEAFPEACERYACPIVAGYPEALRLNMEGAFPDVRLLTPFLDLTIDATVERAVCEAFPRIGSSEIKQAIALARAAQERYEADLAALGQSILRENALTKRPLVILAGHPYHMDPVISNGIPALIESMGADIVTEDAASSLVGTPPVTDVVNQWTFHSRLYRAARLAAERKNTELVQLVSFGCGLDAITSEEVSRILERSGKLYTQLKIDEGDTLGSARIRIRSLLAALGERKRHSVSSARRIAEKPIHFVRSSPLKKNEHEATRKGGPHTLFAPQMAPIHFPILAATLKSLGWNVKLLDETNEQALELGLKHVNNDACYPALVVIGQLLNAVLYDPDFNKDRDAVLLAQTCGPCRASNYTTLMRWALEDVGCGNVPVVSLSAGHIGTESLNLGFLGVRRLMTAVICGDFLQRLTFYGRAYEVKPGSSEAFLTRWQTRFAERLPSGGRALRAALLEARRDFEAIELSVVIKPRVGIVGEILLKYHPWANRQIVNRILAEGAVPVLGDLAMFFHYCLTDYIWRAKQMGGPFAKGLMCAALLRYFESYRVIFREALCGLDVGAVSTTQELADTMDHLVSLGQQAGEGWLLTAEMTEFIKNGIPNVLCLQPFGCLPNHVTGKGVIRKLRQLYADANLCAIDFEPGTSETNVDNRLKLFLAQAFENVAAHHA